MELNGAQFSLLVTSFSELRLWGFETSAARRMLAATGLHARAKDSRELHDRLHDQCKAVMADEGYFTKPLVWTPEMKAVAAKRMHTIDVSTDEIELLAFGARVCAEEFRDNWFEFELFTPGHRLYSCDASGLDELAAHLDACCREGSLSAQEREQ